MMKRSLLQKASQFAEICQKSKEPNVLSVLGPTGSGKTGTVVNLLRSHESLLKKNPLLVSIDAVTLYRELDIGSAKVSGADRNDLDWIGLDILDPSETATVKRFLDSVESPIAEALESQRPVILCGGSGFYERALVEGQAPGAESDSDYQASLETLNSEALAKRLYSFDPLWKDKVHLNDRYRLTRFLDLVDRQGFSYHDLFHTKLRNPRLRSLWTHTHTLFLGLERSREDYSLGLTERIESMFVEGFLSEVQSLREKWGAAAPALSSMGYREVGPHLEGVYSLESCKSKILQSHLDYVKKQKTWFRGLI